MESGLYVVATPIGNLGDITQRALAVLQAAELIAAEDTRHSQRLLQHFGITTPCIPYHEHSDRRAQARILECLAGRGAVALISDAGTPLISDPGYRLVREVQAAGHPVVPVPGPCAAVAALSASGLPTDRFRFEGFLPSKQGQREKRLSDLAAESATLVFYEAPHRLQEALEAMAAAFGEQREAVLARELTKTFETVHRASLGELLQWVRADANQSRGEIVLLVAGARARESEISAEVLGLLRRIALDLPAKQAAAIVSDCTGVRKKILYEALIERE